MKSYLPRPSVRRGLSASEELAVVFDAKLREVCVCRRRIGFEVESVSGILRRGHGDRNRCRALEKVAAEFVRRVAKSKVAVGYATPLDFHGVDYGAEDPHRVRRVKTVRDRENVENGADIVHTQLRGPSADVHLSAANGVRCTPKD